MFKYKVTYEDGSLDFIRANSPKQAFELAKNGTVAFIKWIR